MCSGVQVDAWRGFPFGIRERQLVERGRGCGPGRGGVGGSVRMSAVAGRSASCPAAVARAARVSERVTLWCP